MSASIQVQGISKRFGEYEALHDINFSIPPEAFLVIMGPNGAGKSVLLKTMIGLLKADAGQVLIDARPPERLFMHEIGYIPQIKTINRKFPAMPLELVANGLTGKWPFWMSRKVRDEARAALALVGARHIEHKSLAALSGGELQRVFLARAMIRRPKILALDEPATGIDAIGEADMYQLIEKLRQETGVTVIMVSHDLQAALHHGSHALLLNKKIIAFGTPAKALSNHHLSIAFGHYHHDHNMGV